MNYELKAPKVKHGVLTVASALYLIVAVAGLYMCIQSGDMMKLVFAFCYIAIGLTAFLICYNNMTKCLTFNNVSLTFDGKEYTYQQIERIDTHGGRYGRVYYDIYIDGKRFYTFEKDYTGAREFFYYLDFYKVPGAPRA